MQKFDTTAPITAVLDVPAGHIRFIAADRADTTVEVRPANAGKSRDVTAAEQTTVDYRDGVLHITTTVDNQLFGPSGYVEITVGLPAGSRVEAKAAAADLRGVGRLGEVAFEGSQGTVKLDEAAGARITVQAGDVTIGRLTGPAEVSTAKGDIRVTEATAGDLDLTTQAGNITVDTAPGVSATLDAGTSYGRITNSLTNSGTPAVTIRATTAHGDITARSL
ncbi:DUF4097 family beta strand repeat-containing protein [Saccharothrix variisporea]|uniref:Putative adhesin n=1 Tax=Saccharothrix variisporea TaxID=543527 RepID=A0A495XB84_9PSEU|nr:DUF4097 family beta strand repeat-containing protein [Saccharothrix variisporea]RKT70889.1 putative adhesin [Saccharothrix variisporea]